MSDGKIFSLAGQGLKLDSRADIEPHLEKLRAIDDVEEVHLGGNTFGVEACQALAEVLENKKTLKVADFADIFTGRLITEIPLSLTALCDSLVSHASLTEINLSDNAFGGRSAEPMVNLLSSNTAISILKLNNNGLGPAGGEIVAKALLASAEKSKAQGKKSNLQVVICGRNRLEDSAKVWAEAYATHGTLREVTMQNDGIRMAAMLALINGLSKCPDLELLDLADNTLTEVTESGAIDLSGPRLVAKVLPGWPKLKVLNLSDCVLKPRGGVFVAQVLAKGSNPQLEQLKLENSEIDPKCFGLLAEAIEVHLPGLTLLELNANKGGEEHETIQAIRGALAKHGREDALGELDEMEEVDEEEEEEEYVEFFPEQEEAEKVEETAEPAVVPPSKEEPEVERVTEQLAEVKLDTPAPEAAAPVEVEMKEESAVAAEPPAPVEVEKKEEPHTAAEPPAPAADAPAVPPAVIEAATLAAPPAAAVSLPASTDVPATNGSAAAPAENGTASASKDEPASAPKTEPAPAAAAPEPAPATPAPAPEPTKPSTTSAPPPSSFSGPPGEKKVRRRRSLLGGLEGLGGKIANVFSPKSRRTSQAPAPSGK